MVKKDEIVKRTIDRSYKITSAELKKFLGIEGKINSIILYRGRSPLEKEQGKSSEEDVWEINTSESKVQK